MELDYARTGLSTGLDRGSLKRREKGKKMSKKVPTLIYSLQPLLVVCKMQGTISGPSQKREAFLIGQLGLKRPMRSDSDARLCSLRYSVFSPIPSFRPASCTPWRTNPVSSQCRVVFRKSGMLSIDPVAPHKTITRIPTYLRRPGRRGGRYRSSTIDPAHISQEPCRKVQKAFRGIYNL